VVVPTIRDDFGLSLATASWVITAFVIALAATAPIYGRTADRIGTRTPITVGLTVMAGGAVLAALAPSAGLLIAARGLQGAGAGAIPVLAPAIIAIRATPADRPRALTRMSALAAAAAAGLLLGAVLAELVGWRPVIALPALAIGLVPAIRGLATTNPAPTTRFDVAGAASIAAIAIGINLILQLRTSTTTAIVGGILIVAGAAGWWRSYHRTHPFLPRAVVTRAITWKTGLTAAAIPAAYFALLIAIPVLLTERHGAGRIMIGLLLLPAALAGATVGQISRRLRGRLSGPQTAAIGLALAATALLGTAILADHPAGLAMAFALVAVSFGVGQSALLNELTQATPEPERGAALAVFMVIFFVGGGIGGTLLSALTDATSLTTAVALLAALPTGGAVAALTISDETTS
jgi:MFS family permease